MKKVLLWSGGFDSTLLLMDLVHDMEDDDELITLSVIADVTGDPKNRREEESRASIRQYIADNYPKKFQDIKFREMTVSYPHDLTMYTQGLSQPIIWALSAIPLVPDDSELYLGYIKGDDAMIDIDSIQGIIDNSCRLQQDKKIKLCLPNRYLSKQEILERIMLDYPGILEVCTSCESLDSFGKCGKCLPCKHIQETLLLCALHGKEEVYNKANELLTKWYSIPLSFFFNRQFEGEVSE